jgi:acetyl-CoA carboxylase carboxyl transferase subunit alpha
MAELDFEKPILGLEKKIAELKKFSEEKKIDLSEEVKKFEEKLQDLKKQIYSNLTPWQRVQIARHSERPTTLDYINFIMKDFVEIHGDRLFRDDKAIVSGFAKLDNFKIVIVGHQKGKDTKENLMRNFGSAHPEGYRKALRIFRLADKFKLPIICFIDTPGAYPGIGAEERGQAHSIAENIREMFNIKVPVVIVVIGEGGSGGALGIGVGDKVAMLENSYYSVISPEGCSAILWKNRSKTEEAAKALKLISYDLLELGIIDEVIPEPLGGAHRNPFETAQNLKNFLINSLTELSNKEPETLIEERYNKFRRIGRFQEFSS